MNPDSPPPADASAAAPGFGSGLSRKADTQEALAEACAAALAELATTGEGPPDLALLFASAEHAERLPTLAAAVRQRTGARHLVGCTAAGVLAAGAECEEGLALAVWLGRMPGASVRPFLLSPQEGDADAASPAELWSRQLALPDDPGALVVLLCDPYSIDPSAVLEQIEQERPGLPVVGGLVSGPAEGGRLFVQDLAEPHGACGVVLGGAVRFRTIVSQGCRPIGRHMVVTRGREHVILEIGGKPALQAFRDVLEGLSEADKQLAASSLHVGRAIDEQKASFGRGDFLIRNPIGADFESGSVMIGDHVRTGQTIQLHVRDATSATDDLRELLQEANEKAAAPRGALLFACNGRGEHLFGEPGHDSRMLREAFGPVPLAGFFCAGELGPVGGRNFVHGYTSTIVLFEGAAPAQG